MSDQPITVARAALMAISATCRGSGPMARDHDADTLRAIGIYADAILATLVDDALAGDAA